MGVKPQAIPGAKPSHRHPFHLRGIPVEAGDPQEGVVFRGPKGKALSGAEEVKGPPSGGEEALGGGIIPAVQPAYKGTVEEVFYPAGPFGGHDPGIARQTGVGAFDLPEKGGGIGPVDGVDKDHSRITGAPGIFDQEIEELAGLYPAHLAAGAGVDQRENFILLPGLHEGVGYGHGEIEIGKLRGVAFYPDELLDVRMIDAQDPHIGPAAFPTLFDGLGGGVKDPHEGDRAARHSLGAAHHVPPGTQPGEGKTRSSAGLMDQGRGLKGLEDGLQGILHRKDKTGRKLPQGKPGVHQGGGIGQKIQRGQETIKPFRPFLGVFAEDPLRFGHGPGHPPEHLFRGLHHLALFVPDQITIGQHPQGGFSKGEFGPGKFHPSIIPDHGVDRGWSPTRVRRLWGFFCT